MKKISILGSTGSIGTQALDVIIHNQDKFKVAALSCAKSLPLLCKQIKAFMPDAVAVKEESDARALSGKYKNLEVFWGAKGLKTIASMEGCDMILNSLIGVKGLEPTLAAIKSGKNIAFANKEALVAGGRLVMDAAKKHGVAMLPVDSEHSAIFQSLQGNQGNKIRKILLTASGGPFRGYSLEQLEQVTLEQALNHPNWSMGSKISIDSATMMNKGLEVIETRWLFDVPLDKIQVVVHPQSILHSAVEYMDSSVIGQLGNPDMRIPISYAFSYPRRMDLSDMTQSLNLFSMKNGMFFYTVDREVFKTIDLAYNACREGGSYPIVLNSANEVLVDLFLRGKIRFIDIQNFLIQMMEVHQPKKDLDLTGILEEDMKGREDVRKLVEQSM